MRNLLDENNRFWNRALARAVGTLGVEATGPGFERRSAQDFPLGTVACVGGVCVRV